MMSRHAMMMSYLYANTTANNNTKYLVSTYVCQTGKVYIEQRICDR